MPTLPLRAHHRSYRGGKHDKLLKTMALNGQMDRIADHVNRLVLEDPSDFQRFLFGFIAIDLKVDVELVKEALGPADSGILLRVTAADREAIRQHLAVVAAR